MSAIRTGNGAYRGNGSKARQRRGNVGGPGLESVAPEAPTQALAPETEPRTENAGSHCECVAPVEEQDGPGATEESKPYGWVDEAPLPARRKLSRTSSVLAAAACFAALLVTARVATRPHLSAAEAPLPSTVAMAGAAAARALEVPPPPEVAPADTKVEDLPPAPSPPPVHAANVKTETKLPALPVVLQPAVPPVPEPPPAPEPPKPAAAEPQVVVVEQSAGAPTEMSRPRMSIGSTVRGFDAVAAHGALDAVNPTSCWTAGAAHGYGRARVTFNASGAVQLVQITNPIQGAWLDKECIAHKYTSATVPPFQGTDVTAYTTFFVN